MSPHPTCADTPLEIAPANVARIRDWLANRGGLLIWGSVNMSNLGASWTTPALTNGQPTTKPNWQAAREPSRHIVDAAEIVVVTRREVERFPVEVRPGRSNPLLIKLVDESEDALHEALARHGDDATYCFDYDTQEAVIWLPERVVPLTEWDKEIEHGQGTGPL